MGVTRLKSRLWEGCVPSGGSRQNISPALLASRDTGIPWLLASSTILCFRLVFPSLILILLPSFYKDSCDHSWSTQTIEGNFPISGSLT